MLKHAFPVFWRKIYTEGNLLSFVGEEAWNVALVHSQCKGFEMISLAGIPQLRSGFFKE